MSNSQVGEHAHFLLVYLRAKRIQIGQLEAFLAASQSGGTTFIREMRHVLDLRTADPLVPEDTADAATLKKYIKKATPRR